MFDWLDDNELGRKFANLYNKNSAFRHAASDFVRSMFGDKSNMASVEIGEDGLPIFRITKGNQVVRTRNVSKALSALHDPLTSVKRYTGKQKAFGNLMPSLGGYYNAGLEGLAETLGGTIEQHSYKLDGKDAYKTVMNNIGYSKEGTQIRSIGDGLPVFDDDIVHVFKFIPKDATAALSTDKFVELMQQRLGFEIGKDPTALFKRMKVFSSPRAAGLFRTGNEFTPKVGFFSADQWHKAVYGKVEGQLSILEQQILGGGKIPTTNEETTVLAGRLNRFYGAGDLHGAVEKVIGKSLDGQMIIDSAHLKKYINDIDGRIKAMEGQLGWRTSSDDLRFIQSEIDALKKSKQNILHIMEYGGSSNERFLTDVFGKGDAVFLPTDRYRDLLKRMGHITDQTDPKSIPQIVMLEGQAKKEIKMKTGFLGTSEFRRKATQLEIGITESATFPQFLGSDFINRSFTSEVDNIIREFSEGRSNNGTLRQMVDDVLGMQLPPGTPEAELYEFEQLKKYAKSISSMLDYKIAPGQIDSFGIQFLSMYKNHFLKFRKGREAYTSHGLPDMAFRTRVKGGSFAEISDAGVLFGARKKQTPLELMQNVVRYDKSSGRFGFNGPTFAQIYKPFGGADADDTARIIMMYDREAKKALAFMTRQPFEMGEYMFMQADVSTMPLFGLDRQTKAQLKWAERKKNSAINEFMQKREELTKRLSSSTQKTRNEAEHQVNLLKRRIDEANSEINRLMSSNFEDINLLEKFGEGAEFMAPKGHRVTSATREAYAAPDILRSYNSIGHLNAQEFFARLTGELDNINVSTGSIFEYFGDNYNKVDRKYYKLISSDRKLKEMATDFRSPAAEKEIQRLKNMVAIAEKRGTRAEKIMSRADLTAFVNENASHVLGNWVNVKTVMDNLIETELRGKGLPWDKISVIDRETIIDAAVKTRDLDILNAAAAMTDQATRQLTEWLAKQAENDPENAIRLSRYMFDTRMQSVRSTMESVLQERGLTLDQILTDQDHMSKSVAARVAAVKEMDTNLSNMFGDLSLAGENVLGEFTPTAKETGIARGFIENYIESRKTVLNNAEDLISAGLGGETLDDFFGEEEINRRSLAFLREQGLLGVGKESQLERQVLAIAKHLEQNREHFSDTLGRGVMSPLMTFSTDSRINVSIGDMAMSALSRFYNRGSIEELRALSEETATPENVARIQEITSQLGKAATPFSEVVKAEDLERIGSSGIFARAEREIADAASSKVVKEVTMKKFNMGELRAVLNEAGTRKYAKGAMIAGGLLLALGVLHGNKKIERTPEQMGGPPLLPGGSAYEDYSDVEDYSSMYSMATGGSMNPGTLYKVNVSGSMDPYELQRGIQSITGGSMSSTIYQGRKTVNTGYSDSRSMLLDRMGY